MAEDFRGQEKPEAPGGKSAPKKNKKAASCRRPAGFLSNTTFLKPFSKEWFLEALRELYDVRKLCVAAMMAALSVLLQYISIPLTSGLRLQVTFTVSAISGAVLGPFLSLIRGAVSDIVGFALSGSGAFYFGYTLSAMLSSCVYSCLFWRQKINFPRVLIAKAIVSLAINAALGSLWNVHLLGAKTYGVYFGISLAKQIILYPLEVLVILLLLGSLTLPLGRIGWMPKQEPIKTTRGKIVAVILLSLFAVAVAVLAVLTAKVPEFGAALSDFFGKIYKPIKEFFSNLFGPRS